MFLNLAHNTFRRLNIKFWHPRTTSLLTFPQRGSELHTPTPSCAYTYTSLVHTITPNNFFPHYWFQQLQQQHWEKKGENDHQFEIVYKLLCCVSLQEFLKKEFSEENILFWQACEYFSHVPATDKKQVSPQYQATDVL